MCFLFKYLRYSVRNNLFLILGIVFGVGISLFALEAFDNQCSLEHQLNAPISENENEEGYEPRINLAGKPMKAQKTPQDFVRPRYYSTELGIREKLFVGVLTTPKSFQTLGTALNKTLAHLVDKVMYFSELDGPQHKTQPLFNGLVQFSDSRLILKPFHMLKYIADNLLDNFDFFYLINDSTFVNGRKLLKTVEGVSVGQDVHVGVKLDFESSFCSLDSGILLSNNVMLQVINSLDWCVKNSYSELNDANLGRCIVHATDIPCVDKLKDFEYRGHPLVNPDLQPDRILKDSTLIDAISVWPIKKPDLFYRLHHYFAKKEMEKIELAVSRIQRAILNTTVVLPGNRTDPVYWPVGTPPASKPGNRFDLLRWDYFTEKEIFLKSDFSNIDAIRGADLLDIQNVLNATIEYVESKYDGQLVFKRLVNGYRRFDPARGMDYVLDIACRDSVTGHETHNRFEVCKPLGKVELVPVPYVTENTRVNIVVFVTVDNQDDVLRFINFYTTVCMEKRDKTSLLLVLIYKADHPGKGAENDVHTAVKATAVKQSQRFRKDNNKIMWLSVKLPAKPPPANQLTFLLMDLAVKKFSADNLLLVCSGSAELRQDYLNRVRMNTVKGKQIFSPIPFSEFNPVVVYNEDLLRPKELDINKNYGHYDVTNEDHLSFYVKDYKSARKVIEANLPLAHTDKDLGNEWEGENDRITLYGLFVRFTELHVLRAVEPSLRLRHVELSCVADDDLCVERRAHNLGPRSQLGQLLLDYRNLRRRRNVPY